MSIQAKSYVSENLKLEHELQVSAQVSLVNRATGRCVVLRFRGRGRGDFKPRGFRGGRGRGDRDGDTWAPPPRDYSR